MMHEGLPAIPEVFAYLNLSNRAGLKDELPELSEVTYILQAYFDLLW